MHIRLDSPISNTRSAEQGIGATSVVAAPEVDATAPSRRDGGDKAHGHNGGHGHLRQVLRQALMELGFAPMPGPARSGDAEGDQSGGTGSANVGHDMAQFMHALFQAVKAESGPGTASGAALPTDPKSGFAARLAALIGQVGSGSAPQALQAAFDKLTADLHPAVAPAATPDATSAAPGAAAPASDPAMPASATPSDAAATTAAVPTTVETATDTAPTSARTATPTSADPVTTAVAGAPVAPTLQALLSRLQQDLGYLGRVRWTSAATGNALNLTA